MLSLVLLSTNWMGCWINGLIKCLFELFHPNELLIIVMLSAVGHTMCPRLHEIILAGVTVSIFISSTAASTEEQKHLFPPVAKIMNLLPENWISSYIQNYVTSTVFKFITFIYCTVVQYFMYECTSFPVFPLFFFIDAPLVTWSGWMELKSPVFTPSVPRGRVIGGHVWPSHHQNSLATALKVTEDATVKQRWPSTGRTWAWASALSSPSASASWLC